MTYSFHSIRTKNKDKNKWNSQTSVLYPYHQRKDLKRVKVIVKSKTQILINSNKNKGKNIQVHIS
jgi:hypothetical protein